MIYRCLILFLLIAFLACNEKENSLGIKKILVVTTTTMITDLVNNIGKEKIELKGIMKAGVDPHLYKATERDITQLLNADIVFYNGLHLEGKLVELFEKMEKRGGNIYAISDGIEKSMLIVSTDFADNYDPHIWFDISLWKKAAVFVAHKLSLIDSSNKEYYFKNMTEYLSKLDSAEKNVREKVSELPEEKRILITAHDAFNYLGRAYNFKVLGLQGISTLSEASVFDVQNLANFIIEHNVKAVFVESSVPVKNIQALRQAAKAKGKEIKIGGELFSDSLGDIDKPEGTYIGMILHNVEKIVNSLK